MTHPAERAADQLQRPDAPARAAAGPGVQDLATPATGGLAGHTGRFGVVSRSAMLGVQRAAGNRAASALAGGQGSSGAAAGRTVHRHRDAPVPHAHSVPGTDEAGRLAFVQRMSDGDVAQRLGLGFLADIAGGMFGGGAGEAEQLAGGGAATCTEKPTINPASPVPVTINADTALDFVNQIKSALGGNPHMAPSFSYAPDTDDAGKITKVNLTLDYSIVRPRYGMGRGDAAEVALIRKAEGLIKAHEERHAAVAKDFAQRAVCAAVGKTAATYKAAIEAQLCAMNKAQEALDKSEGTIAWTLNPEGTKVVDVSLAGLSSASYPCTTP